MEHFDGYYNPVGNKKFGVHFWLLLFLALKMHLKWLEKNRLKSPHSYLGSKCSLMYAKSSLVSDIAPLLPRFFATGWYVMVVFHFC